MPLLTLPAEISKSISNPALGEPTTVRSRRLPRMSSRTRTIGCPALMNPPIATVMPSCTNDMACAASVRTVVLLIATRRREHRQGDILVELLEAHLHSHTDVHVGLRATHDVGH